jgi:hypothetical protein
MENVLAIFLFYSQLRGILFEEERMVVDLDGEGPAPLHGPEGQTIKYYNIVSESLQYEGYSRTRSPF